MAYSKRKDIKTYKSQVYFQDIVTFFNSIISQDKYSLEKNNVHIVFYTNDNSTFSFNSIEEFLEPDSINCLEKSKLTSFNFSLNNAININFDSHYAVLSYEVNSDIGFFLFNLAKDTLKLRTSSFVSFIFDNPFFYLFITLTIYFSVSLLYFKRIDELSMVILTLSIFSIIVLSDKLQGVNILMGNNKDNFLIRNRDNLLIACGSLVVGYILGLITPFN